MATKYIPKAPPPAAAGPPSRSSPSSSSSSPCSSAMPPPATCGTSSWRSRTRPARRWACPRCRGTSAWPGTRGGTRSPGAATARWCTRRAPTARTCSGAAAPGGRRRRPWARGCRSAPATTTGATAATAACAGTTRRSCGATPAGWAAPWSPATTAGEPSSPATTTRRETTSACAPTD